MGFMRETATRHRNQIREENWTHDDLVREVAYQRARNENLYIKYQGIKEHNIKLRAERNGTKQNEKYLLETVEDYKKRYFSYVEGARVAEQSYEAEILDLEKRVRRLQRALDDAERELEMIKSG